LKWPQKAHLIYNKQPRDRRKEMGTRKKRGGLTSFGACWMVPDRSQFGGHGCWSSLLFLASPASPVMGQPVVTWGEMADGLLLFVVVVSNPNPAALGAVHRCWVCVMREREWERECVWEIGAHTRVARSNWKGPKSKCKVTEEIS
jgi:hypothetical protein